MTWFRVGGPAEVLFRPADARISRRSSQALPADVPVTVLGVGSNLLVRDGGVPGVVIRLVPRLHRHRRRRRRRSCAGAGALDSTSR